LPAAPNHQSRPCTGDGEAPCGDLSFPVSIPHRMPDGGFPTLRLFGLHAQHIVENPHYRATNLAYFAPP